MTVLTVCTSAILASLIVGTALDPIRVRRVGHDRVDADLVGRGGRRLVSIRPCRPTITPAAVGAWADAIARSLRHGSTLRSALAAVVPDDEALDAHATSLRQRLDRGATVADACDHWADENSERSTSGAELLVAFAAVVGAAAHLGGSASTPLERFAVTMRQRVSDELERDAQSAQAKLSARVLTLVPLAVLALLLGTDADVRQVLTEPAGAATVGIGLALNAVGSWWMRRIVGAGPIGAR